MAARAPGPPGLMSGGSRVRAATLDDAPAIAHIRVETWRWAYRGIVPDEILDGLTVEAGVENWRRTIETAADNGRSVWVALDPDDEVVGYAAVGPEREGSELARGEVYALYVHPTRQGRGAGRALMAVGTHWLSDRGLIPVQVWVLADNPSRRFYQRLGGQLCGQREITLGIPLGEVAYCWPSPIDPPSP